jgi:hypothetical protein
VRLLAVAASLVAGLGLAPACTPAASNRHLREQPNRGHAVHLARRAWESTFVVGNPLNYFEPYESLPAHHENQLTRALVVVLRVSPMAHAAWLRRVDSELALQALPAVDWRVQRRDIVPAGTPADFDGLRVISIFLSGERADDGSVVKASDRGQVLDAIALYGTDWRSSSRTRSPAILPIGRRLN